jgi:hypothetical protein
MATAKKDEQSVFATLSTISIKDKIQIKGKLDYLSWANAWSMLKDQYPDAQRTVYEDFRGLNYHTDNNTAYVKVGVTINGLEHIDYLPVMDFRNNSIPIGKITSMDVNKSIQRSTAKAIAMHGLGLSLWTGEDLPDAGSAPAANTTTASEKPKDLPALIEDSKDWGNVSKYLSDSKDKNFEKLFAQVAKKFSVSDELKQKLETLHKG